MVWYYLHIAACNHLQAQVEVHMASKWGHRPTTKSSPLVPTWCEAVARGSRVALLLDLGSIWIALGPTSAQIGANLGSSWGTRVKLGQVGPLWGEPRPKLCPPGQFCRLNATRWKLAFLPLFPTLFGHWTCLGPSFGTSKAQVAYAGWAQGGPKLEPTGPSPSGLLFGQLKAKDVPNVAFWNCKKLASNLCPQCISQASKTQASPHWSGMAVKDGWWLRTEAVWQWRTARACGRQLLVPSVAF